jgi:hypothetical protein
LRAIPSQTERRVLSRARFLVERRLQGILSAQTVTARFDLRNALTSLTGQVARFYE